MRVKEDGIEPNQTESEITAAKSLLRQHGYRVIRLEDIRRYSVCDEVPDYGFRSPRDLAGRDGYARHVMEQQALHMGRALFKEHAIDFSFLPLRKNSPHLGTRIEGRIELIMPYTRGD